MAGLQGLTNIISREPLPEAGPERAKGLQARAKLLREWAKTSAPTRAELEAALRRLNPKQNPLCALFVVRLLLTPTETNPALEDVEVVQRVESLVATADPLDLLVARRETERLAGHLCAAAGTDPLRAVCALVPATTILRAIAQTAPGELTSAHVHFLQLALLAKRYAAASELVSAPIYAAAPSMPALDVQRFFYYKARVLIGLRRLDEAIAASEMVLTLPAKAVSGVALATYKQLVLVSLIVHGAAPTLPAAVPSIVQNAFAREQPIAQVEPYSEIASAFESGERGFLQDALRARETVLIEDNNIGLAKQLDRALLRQRVRELKLVYKTLRMSDIMQLLEAPPIRKEVPSASSFSHSLAPKRPSLAAGRRGRARPRASGHADHSAGAGAATGERPASDDHAATPAGDHAAAQASAEHDILAAQADPVAAPPAARNFGEDPEPLTADLLESVLWDLVENEDFPLSIAQDTGIVSFLAALPDQAARDSTALETQMGLLQRLLQDLHKLDTSVSSSEHLVAHYASANAPLLPFTT